MSDYKVLSNILMAISLNPQLADDYEKELEEASKVLKELSELSEDNEVLWDGSKV